MAAATEEETEALRPYIAGEQPDYRGEIGIYCPVHPDTRRSASINLEKGVWYCHSGCGGGSIRQLVETSERWISPEGRVKEARPSAARPIEGAARSDLPKTESVRLWHRRLLRERDALDWLVEERGITKQTIQKATIGFDGRFYKIPVFAPDRSLWNVRTYDPKPGDRRKIWGVRGNNEPRLYPVGVLERAKPGDVIVWCEGEWDALLALQTGYLAVTRTGAAKVWKQEWDAYFDNLNVFLCHDRDEMGLDGDRLVGSALEGVAASVRYVRLPFKVRKKGGLDLSDYLLDTEPDNRGVALGSLLKQASYKPEES